MLMLMLMLIAGNTITYRTPVAYIDLQLVEWFLSQVCVTTPALPPRILDMYYGNPVLETLATVVGLQW